MIWDVAAGALRATLAGHATMSVPWLFRRTAQNRDGELDRPSSCGIAVRANFWRRSPVTPTASRESAFPRTEVVCCLRVGTGRCGFGIWARTENGRYHRTRDGNRCHGFLPQHFSAATGARTIQLDSGKGWGLVPRRSESKGFFIGARAIVPSY